MRTPTGFICGTRAVVLTAPAVYRVVCATCGSGGYTTHATSMAANTACIRDSNRPCAQCGAK